MSSIKQVTIPDLGGADQVDIIEVQISQGDQVEKEDALITLESDKSSIDVPSPYAGTIKKLQISEGDQAKEGDVILEIEVADDSAQADQSSDSEQTSSTSEGSSEQQTEQSSTDKGESQSQSVTLPDVGTEDAVDIIEVSVEKGDEIEADDPLMTIESDKSSMDIPAPFGGKIESIQVKAGDQAKHGDEIMTIATAAGAASTDQKASSEQASSDQQSSESSQPSDTDESSDAGQQQKAASSNDDSNVSVDLAKSNQQIVHAGPAVRRLANELGVDLANVKGSGRKGRIVLKDVHQYVKDVMKQQQSGAASGSGLNIAPPPKVDFSQFGEIETQPLSKIKKLTGSNLHRNWVSIPHVTQFDEADITEMEDFRQQNKAKVEKEGAKLTPLVFIMKAAVAALKAYPQFNASLSETGEELILKHYYHIGVAVDTPNGLVVPVINDVDQKGFIELSQELLEISKKARDGKLMPKDMQGGCFSVSSLGGIGGTAFTPIINAPEVAILGVSRTYTKADYIEGEFQPRLKLPLSLSYDHRVIDGADGARFITYLSQCLADMRQLLM